METGFTPVNDVSPSFAGAAPPGSPRRRGLRRWWVYAAAIFLVLWFGAPLLAPHPTGAPASPAVSAGFTPAPGAVSTVVPRGPVDVTSKDAASQGSPVAPVVIVEFGDFQCPYCRAAVPIMKQVLARYPEAVKLEFRHFPLQSVHAQALPAAEAAACAGMQGKFWPYHDALYARQDELSDQLYDAMAQDLGFDVAAFSRCRQGHLMLARVEADYEAGVAAGVRGTPTWFVNGYRVEGALPLEFWDRAVPGVVQLLSQPKP